jgi:steroid 5-alpha reductase family enzyme
MDLKDGPMKKENLRYYIGILVILLLGFGVALAGSQGGFQVAGFPIYALGILVAFGIQWIVFVHAYLNKTEKYFDLTGSITYITVMLLAFLTSPVKDLRSWLLLGMVSVWALRLGSFLYLRIKKAGEDRRFREIKQSFLRFLQTWTIQGLWVTFSLAAALVVVTSTKRVGLDLFMIFGVLVWLIGFGIETIADRQKNQFRQNPDNAGKFIQTGLWSWSRHPNYFGEIVLWVGVLIIALPVLEGWQWVALISPVFITLLLTKVSGIPMLEKRADEKWGGRENYETYKASTSVLIPLPPKGAKS